MQHPGCYFRILRAARRQIKATEARGAYAEGQAPLLAAQIADAEEMLDLARVIGNERLIASAERHLDGTKQTAELVAGEARHAREMVAQLQDLLRDGV